MNFSKAILSTSIFIFAPLAAPACDLCSVYTATEAQGLATGWSAGFAEQYTHFGTLRLDGTKQPNDTDQRLDSSFTEILLGYGFNDRFSGQLTVPYIVRTFHRPEGFRTDHGTVSGLGDASLIGRFLVLRRDGEKVTFTWSLLGGVKLPTGSASQIKEEFNEVDVPGAPESGVHGHDLALGTGSTDAIVGTNLFLRANRFFVTGLVQYAARSKGAYHYRFADDTRWELAPGYYVTLEHEHTIGVQCVVSGEHKGKDTFAGEAADDTGITGVFVGPKVSFTQGVHTNAELALELPVQTRNTALQLVADYRIRGGFTWRF